MCAVSEWVGDISETLYKKHHIIIWYVLNLLTDSSAICFSNKQMWALSPTSSTSTRLISGSVSAAPYFLFFLAPPCSSPTTASLSFFWLCVLFDLGYNLRLGIFPQCRRLKCLFFIILWHDNYLPRLTYFRVCVLPEVLFQAHNHQTEGPLGMTLL